jgi:hypothetical protein
MSFQTYVLKIWKKSVKTQYVLDTTMRKQIRNCDIECTTISLIELMCVIFNSIAFISWQVVRKRRRLVFVKPRWHETQLFHSKQYIYIYIRLKIKPNSVRIRFLSFQIFVLPSTGFELTPLIHCSTIRLAIRPAP